MQTIPYFIFRQAIQTIVKNTERGTLLTTHSMAEAETVCDCVAIWCLEDWGGCLSLLSLGPQVLKERITVHCDQLVLFTSSIYDQTPSSAFAIEEEMKRPVFF